VQFDYYTSSYVESHIRESNTQYPRTFTTYTSSVHYTPTVTFGANVAPTVYTIPFANTTINRPTGPQAAELVISSYYTTGTGFNSVWDLATDPWTISR